MTILAIDPGSRESAWVLFDEDADRRGDNPILDHGKAANGFVRGMLYGMIEVRRFDQLVIEWVQSYGMPVGAEVFDTCAWVGRYVEAFEANQLRFDAVLMQRQNVKLHLCHSARAKDANVRAALIDRYGGGRASAIGTKKAPGPLYGMKADRWAALGVAVTFADRDVKAIADAVDSSVGHVLG